MPNAQVVCAAHPTDHFGPPTVELLARVAQARTVGVNPRGRAGTQASLAQMVDGIEAARRELALPPWIFWGMSGGGWLAQLYAHRHPAAVAGIVIESACASFAQRLADPECVLSPRFPAWRPRMEAAGLLDSDAPPEVGPTDLFEWTEVADVGSVLRLRSGPAVLVSPTPLAPAMKDAMPELVRFDSRQWLGALRVPTLVLCGTADPVVPVRHARAVHEAIAGSTFVAIEGAGHVPTAQQHAAVASALQSFLSRLSR